MALPTGFADLLTAYDAPVGTFLNVIGIVVDISIAFQNRKTQQYQCKFRLQDRRMRDSVNGNRGLEVSFFHTLEKSLPQVQELGDVLLLRNIKAYQYNGNHVLNSNYQTNHIVFPSKAIPQKAFEAPYMSGQQKLNPRGGIDVDKQRLTLEETAYIINLKADFSEVKPLPAPVGATAVPALIGNARTKLEKAKLSNKFQLVKELQHFKFADVCGEVVKKYPNQYGNCELYISDYTPNEQLFYYAPPEEADQAVNAYQDGDQFGYNGPSKRQWPGPYGFYVLKVDLTAPHSSFANQHVQEGDVVLLQNLKMKLGPTNKLEGNMWPDSFDPSKVKIQFMKNRDSPEVQALQERRARYWRERSAKGLIVPHQPNEPPPAKLSKGQKKRERALRQEQEKKEAEITSMKAKINSAEILAAKKTNPHIRCSHVDQPLVNLSGIVNPPPERYTNATSDGTFYTLPFVNANYRTRARVLDFDPPSLEDFAIPVEPSESDSLYDYSPATATWEWSFSLQLGNCSARNEVKQWVNVGHLEAQFLLGSSFTYEPRGLRSEPRLVEKLREKLAILWGDLEERKQAGDAVVKDVSNVSNVAFECCLAEYGTLREGGDEGNVEDWSREFMMHGVTIL